MYSYSILGQYALTAISGLICLIMIFMQGVAKVKEKALYRATALFVLNIATIGMLSCYFYLQEGLFQQYEVGLPLRCIDYALYALIPLTWTLLLKALATESGVHGTSVMIHLGRLLSAIALVVFLILVIGFMNDAYDFASAVAANVYHITELTFSAVSIALLVSCSLYIIPGLLLKFPKRYVLINVIFLSIYFVYQIIYTQDIGQTETFSWADMRYDCNGWILSAINICSCVFVYKKDFQPLYRAASEPISTNKPEIASPSPFDKIAQSHRLTKREREILEYIYKGYSNAMIAETLCISLSTVKTHIHNLFEKLGVSSRMEATFLLQNTPNNKNENTASE